MTPERLAFVTALLKWTGVFSLIAFVYLVSDIHLIPKNAFLPVSRWLGWLLPIPEDMLADISFLISWASFVAWEYLRTKNKMKQT